MSRQRTGEALFRMLAVLAVLGTVETMRSLATRRAMRKVASSAVSRS